jgi:3-oxoacyl-[acyl-carrier-protein] synthase II
MITAPPIAVTGMAWTTSLGDDLAAVWDRLLAGHAGFQPLLYEGRLRNSLAAIVPDVSMELLASERLLRITRSALEHALEAAGRRASEPDVYLVLGTSLGACLESSVAGESLYTWADALGRAVGASTPPIALSTACSSGSDAILLGAELIRSGSARCCVCGGGDVVTWSKRIAHSTLGTMSPSSLRAFDVRHDGTLLGEGAAFVVLEALEDDTKPLALLRGVGAANEACGMTAADITGAAARYAIERSLADAKLETHEIGLVNAHGSGTQMNDTTERNAFNIVFTGPNGPLVFATKGNFGHTLGATGALEAVALISALRARITPPIIGLEQPDPEFRLPLAYGSAVTCDARYGLSLTLGFGGFDTSLIFEVVR